MQKFALLSLFLFFDYSYARQQFYDEEVPCQELNSHCYDELDTPPIYVPVVPMEFFAELEEEETESEPTEVDEEQVLEQNP